MPCATDLSVPCQDNLVDQRPRPRTRLHNNIRQFKVRTDGTIAYDIHKCALAAVLAPSSYQQAMEIKEWKVAMDDEFPALQQNKT